MSIPFITFGMGGHGKVVIDAANRIGKPPLFVVDDNPHSTELISVPAVSSKDDRWIRLTDFEFIVAIGDNLTRRVKYAELLAKGGSTFRLVHPFANISKHAQLGIGTVVCAGGVINPGAIIGENCIINTCASIDHDCIVGDHCHICPGVRLAGNVTVGEGSMLGTGALVIPGKTIGKNCVIGAGAVVVNDLPDGVLAYGVPAKIKR